MDRAFSSIRLPLGAYQYVRLGGVDLGAQFTNGGKEPNTLLAVFSSPIDVQFENRDLTLLLSEEAQRHLIAALQANLDGDQQRAHELITVFHPEYGEIIA